MELLIAMIVATYVVKNGVVDAAYAVRGKPSPRYELAKARIARATAKAAARPARPGTRSWRPHGPAARYIGQLWADSWEDAQHRHTRRREARLAAKLNAKPTGAARTYLRGVRRDFSDRAWGKWDRSWYEREARRRGPAAADQIVTGETVESSTATSTHAAGSERGDQLRDGIRIDRPAQTETTLASDSAPPLQRAWLVTKPNGDRLVNLDGKNLDLYQRHGHQVTPVWGIDTGSGFQLMDPPHTTTPADGPARESEPSPEAGADRSTTGPSDGHVAARSSHTSVASNGTTPGHGSRSGPVPVVTSVPAGPAGSATNGINTGGNTSMSSTSIPAGEATGLSSAIGYCSQTAQAAEQAVSSVDAVVASLKAGDVGDGTTGHLARAQEQFSAAAAALREAEKELVSHQSVAEAYHANPDAGSREFVTNN